MYTPIGLKAGLYSVVRMVNEQKLRQFLVKQVVKLQRTIAGLAAGRQEPLQAERLLPAHYQRLQSVLDAVPALIAYVDEEERYRFNNRRYAQVHGRSLADFTGLRVGDVIGPAAYERARPNIEAALNGRLVQFEMPFGTDAQGRDRHVYASYVPDVGEDGSVRGFVALVMDISERKQAELALAASERRWRTVFESACVGMAIVDAEGRPLETNPALRRFLGASDAELRSTRCNDLTYKPDREQSAGLFHQLVQGPRSDYRLEKRYLRQDHRIVWGDTAVSAVRDAHGAFQYAVPMVIDTTARKNAENALRQSEARFRQILEAAPDAMVIANRARRITMVNAQATTMFGYSRDELIGQPVDLLVPDRFRSEHSHRYETYFRQTRPRPLRAGLDLLGLRKDGTEIPVEINLSPVETSEGLMVTAAIRDVTDRRQAEQALRRSEAAYRDLVMHATYGIYRSCRDGRLLSANPALAKMLGYESVDELMGIDLGRDLYVDPQERETVIARHQAQDRIRDVQIEWKRKDGRRVTVRLNGRTLRNDRGEVECFEVMVEDITERRRLEAQLRQAQKMEAIGRLAGGVAHDFNNILTAILGVSDLLLQDLGPDDPRRTDILEIRDAGKRAAALTRQLLAFSRQQLLIPERLDLNALITNAERLLRRVIGEDIQVKTALDPALGSVEADPGQLEQVLLNLAVNARDAMPNGGTLTISTANVELDETYREQHVEVKPGAYVMLAVSDTGVGMDRDTQSHLFEPFFTTKEAGKGTGLGLATVYGIVKQSGGYIWAYSEPGEGTTFKIYLPRVQGGAQQHGSQTAQAVRGGTEVILVVEDEDSVRRLAQRVLEGGGYTVLAASNGEEALAIFRQREADVALVVTDLVMPRMGGHLLLETLRDEGKTVACLFVSGYSERERHERRLLEGEFPFLPKPWTVESLLRKVREVLDHASGSR